MILSSGFKRSLIYVFSFILSCFMIAACGDLFGGGDDDKESSKSSGSGDESPAAGSLSLNNLGGSYPEGLSITSLPEEVDSKPGVAAPGTLAIELALQEPATEDVDTTQKHPKTLAEEIKKRLDGDEAIDCFAPNIFKSLKFRDQRIDFCYEFDYGIISGKPLGTKDPKDLGCLKYEDPNVDPDPNAPPPNCNLTRLGELDAEEALKDAILDQIIPDPPKNPDEPCMITTSKILITQATKKVEAALNLFQGMLCQAKKDNLADELPEVGKSLDLIKAFDIFKEGEGKGSNISKASIERLQDQDGKATYRSDVKMTSSDGRSFDIGLIHSPNDENNVEYNGVLFLRGTSPMVDVGTSISYQKSGTDYASSKIKYEVRQMDLSDTDLELFNSLGQVNFEGMPENADNSKISNMKYFAFDVNPSSYAGTLSFWNNPGARYTETARGFTFYSEQNDDGTLSGCAYAGAAMNMSIRKSLRETQNDPANPITLKVDGCLTPFISHGACGQPGQKNGPEAWKQCFAQQSDGKYAISTIDSEDFKVIQAGPDIPFIKMDIKKVTKTDD